MTGNESPGSTEPAPGTLGAILAKTSKGMADKLAELREGLDHPVRRGAPRRRSSPAAHCGIRRSTWHTKPVP
jgi:hypothetical protein